VRYKRYFSTLDEASNESEQRDEQGCTTMKKDQFFYLINPSNLYLILVISIPWNCVGLWVLGILLNVTSD